MRRFIIPIAILPLIVTDIICLSHGHHPVDGVVFDLLASALFTVLALAGEKRARKCAAMLFSAIFIPLSSVLMPHPGWARFCLLPLAAGEILYVFCGWHKLTALSLMAIPNIVIYAIVGEIKGSLAPHLPEPLLLSCFILLYAVYCKMLTPGARPEHLLYFTCPEGRKDVPGTLKEVVKEVFDDALLRADAEDDSLLLQISRCGRWEAIELAEAALAEYAEKTGEPVSEISFRIVKVK